MLQQEITILAMAFLTSAIVLVPIVWKTHWFIQLEKVNAKVRAAEDEYERAVSNVAARTRGKLIVHDKVMKLIEAERQPIVRKLQRLEWEREFIKDKLLLFKK